MNVVGLSKKRILLFKFDLENSDLNFLEKSGKLFTSLILSIILYPILCLLFYNSPGFPKPTNRNISKVKIHF